MRVICIDGVKAGTFTMSRNGNPYISDTSDEIYEGEIYTVVGQSKRNNAYFLAERTKEHICYRKERFMITSEKEEIKLETVSVLNIN